MRFFRLAERRIAEKTGQGVVSFISNYSFTTEPSFVVLRQKLLASFDKFWIENMHGNRKSSEYAPDGKTSETIFAIPKFSVGIKQSVVISTWVKGKKENTSSQVLYRDDLNKARATDRRAQLLASLNAENFNAQYKTATPTRENRFTFKPSDISSDYHTWVKLIDLCAVQPSNGLMEKRGGALISIDRVELQTRMQAYLNRELSWHDYERLNYGLTELQAGFEPEAARKKLLAAEAFNAEQLVRYALRPFETRWCYYTAVNPIWNRARPSLWAQCWSANRFLLTRMNASKNPEGAPMGYTPLLCDDHYLSPDAVAIPFQLRLEDSTRSNQAQMDLLASLTPDDHDGIVANLSKSARAYLASLGISDADESAESASLLWHHALAIGYSPAYLKENADGIRENWPRVPLPATKDMLLASAALGRQIAVLLDTEMPVDGVTTGTIRNELRTIAVISRAGGGALNPDAGELELTAGWGHAGKGGVTMPGKGRVVGRDYTSEERAAITAEAMECFGARTCDVWLNNVAYWRNVLTNV